MNKKTIVVGGVVLVVAAVALSVHFASHSGGEALEDEDADVVNATVPAGQTPANQKPVGVPPAPREAMQALAKAKKVTPFKLAKDSAVTVEEGDTSDKPVETGVREPAELANWKATVDKLEAAEGGENPLTDDDAVAFKAIFDKLSAEQKEEYVHLALCQLKDESVVCLAVLVYDAKEPVPVLDKVFDDISHRDRDIVRPIMQRLAADATHPKQAAAKEWLDDYT